MQRARAPFIRRVRIEKRVDRLYQAQQNVEPTSDHVENPCRKAGSLFSQRQVPDGFFVFVAI